MPGVTSFAWLRARSTNFEEWTIVRVKYFTIPFHVCGLKQERPSTSVSHSRSLKVPFILKSFSSGERVEARVVGGEEGVNADAT